MRTAAIPSDGEGNVGSLVVITCVKCEGLQRCCSARVNRYVCESYVYWTVYHCDS